MTAVRVLGRERFTNKVALVTGGAVGLGNAIALAMAEEGAAVAIADIDGDAARRAADELTARDLVGVAVECDVTDENLVNRAIAEVVTRLGGIDILVNNAAKHLSKYNQAFTVLERDEVRALFDVNVIGVINCTVGCRPSMTSRAGGAILNIASVAGHSVTSPYGVSKLAVRGLTTAFAKELAPDGIRVNAVSPGLVATESALADLAPALLQDYVDNRQLIHRQGLVADVVAAALFLCSDDAAFITAETLKVSAGYPLEL
jgi:3-oxoacyl-[acyl-carrier protein] reductase